MFWVLKVSIMVSCWILIILLVFMWVVGCFFIDLIKDVFEEYLYDVEFVGVEYIVICEEWGMYIEVFGYNDKFLVFLEQVLVIMCDFDICED